MTLSVFRFARLLREVRTTFALALPLVLGHISTGLIGFVDSVLAGRHGANTLAAVAVGVALWSFAIVVLIGVLLALPPTVSQLDGAGRRSEVASVFRQALWLALTLAVGLFVYLSAAGLLLEPLGIAPEVRPAARDFLHGIRWGIPALALYFCMRYLSEGLHWTWPTMLLGMGGLVLLLPLGYALMFGALGLPELGAAGLGYATSITLWCQALSFALYLARSRRFADLRLFARIEPPCWSMIRSLLKLGLPIGVSIFMEGSLFIATALLIGGLGEVPVAAHQIAINVSSVTFMGALGLAEATTVRVGHAAGAGRARAIRRAAWAGYALVILVQSLAGLAMLLANETIASIYTRNAEVVAMAATLLLYAAAFQLSDGVQVVSGAALRGLKDTRIPMLITAFSYWGVGMTLGAGLGFGLGWGVQGMWCGLIAGLTFAALLLARRFARLSRRPLRGSGTVG